MKKILLIIFVILFIGALYFFLREPKFLISDIYYTNNNFIPNKVLEQNFVYLKEKNFLLAYFSFNKYKKRFLKRFPEVKGLTVSIKSPNILRINVQEKEPFVLLINKKKNIVVSDDGFVLNSLNNQASINNLSQILIIKGVGNNVIKENRLKIDLLTDIKYLSNSIRLNFPDDSFQILFDNSQIVILKNDSIPIKIGCLSNLEVKFANLKEFLTYLPYEKQKNISYIDLRIPDRIVLKYNTTYENK
ncbi:MAG: hypothetical protein WC860_01335 [Candidatus Margulisiibacteriota bacterium]|jgi:cell division septal protein FtsQ